MPDQAAGTPTNAPSLAVAINKYAISIDYPFPMPDPGSDPALQRESVKKILGNIWLNLNASDPEEALADAWSTPEGTNPFAPSPPGLEERWARLVTERLMCTPYNGPGQLYLGDYRRDGEILRLFQRDADPLCSLVFACQQLSSMGAMSRGFTLNPFFNAGGSQEGTLNNLKVMDPESGTELRSLRGGWFPGQELMTASRCYKKPNFGPGAVWTADGRNKGDPTPGPNKSGAHIGFLLRTHPDERSIQVFDTGALRARPPEQPCPKFRLKGSKRGVGNYDYGWAESVSFTYPDVFQGLGVLPPESEAQSLEFGIRRLRRARPLGFARLVLQRHSGTFDSNGVEAPGELIFATPMLLMHDPGDPERNFSISRFMWSLRQVPGTDWLRWTWLIFVPARVTLTETIIQQSSRDWSLSRTLDAAYNDGAGDFSKIPATWHTDGAACILYLSTWCDRNSETGKVWSGKKWVNAPVWKDQAGSYEQGMVGIEAIRKDKSTSIPSHSSLYSLPWNTPSGSAKLEAADFDEYPYFKGDWDGQ